jgi:hypothetical protein
MSKVIYFNVVNIIITLFYSFKKIHYAIAFTILNEIKATAFFVHYYFFYTFNIVLTKEMIINMALNSRKVEVVNR